MFDPYFERLASWATTERFAAEVAAARDTFFAGTGLIHEDDRSFEVRMSALSEYYLLDRPLTLDPSGRTPAALYEHEQAPLLEEEGRAAFAGLTRSRNGLFEIRRIREGVIRIQDTFDATEYEVEERRRMLGLEKGDLVQARLLPLPNRVVFGRTFFYHPREARSLLLKAMKRRRKAGQLASSEDKQRTLWQLARTALLHERQQANNRTRIAVDRIYADL